jgi:ATP-dependent exoDNAse (exonuclease V) beta subunit
MRAAAASDRYAPPAGPAASYGEQLALLAPSPAAPGAESTALTAEQECAVARRRGGLLLAAGAGSGKTSVLVERFVRAVRDDGVAPASILAITFTDRAAAELRERVRERLLALGEREAARDTEAAFVTTFHGFCMRVLLSHALLAGVDPRAEVLDEALAARMRERAFSLALCEFQADRQAPAVDLLASYGLERVETMVARVYAELRSRGHVRPRLPAVGQVSSGSDVKAAQACALLGELLERFGRAYEALKHGRAVLDFDDLELGALSLLQAQESVRAAWSERFELLMVDEFQDTNPRQLEILRALERDNLFTVGDQLQSIYGFRHADVRLFRARRDELAARGASLQLTRNFRSNSALLSAVNTVFATRIGDDYTPLVAERSEPAAGVGNARVPAVELLLTSRRGWNGDEQHEPGASAPAGPGGAPGWRQAEARLLAARVAELVERGEFAAGEIAVLLRAGGDADTYEHALAQRGLSTVASVGGFWGRQQVLDLLAYLRALANPLDELALFGTLASPLVGISSDGLALLARAAAASSEPVWATIEGAGARGELRLPEADRDSLARFARRIASERRTLSALPIARLIERAMAASDYEEHVLALDAGTRRMANVRKLLRLARRFEASEGRDLHAFLDHAAHSSELASGPEPDAPVAGQEADAVRLMSIHAAKGLEFGVVCVGDLGRQPNLSVPELLVDGRRIGLRLARLDGSQPEACLDHVQLCEQRKRAQAEEEDRILYVAMTRARERLILSGAVDFERWPEAKQGAPPISWLGPALAPQLPQVARDYASEMSASAAEAGARASGSGPQLRDVELACGEHGRLRCRLSLPPPRGASAQAPAATVTTRARPRDRNHRTDEDRARRHARRRAKGSSRGESPLQRGPAAPLADVDSLSYTTLRELERCGYRFYLERVLGLEESRQRARARASGALDSRARGTLVHRVMESVDFSARVPATARSVASAARELALRASRADCEEIAALVCAAVAPGVGAHTGARALGDSPAARVVAAEQVRREHPFAFSVGQARPLLTGVIDLLAREADGGFMVLDYKSDALDSADDVGELVTREYELQRMVYALAALRTGAPHVEVIHWFLQRPREWVGASYASAERNELESRLAARMQSASARGFAVSEGPHRALCESCPGRLGLCSWSEANTMRDLDPPQPRANGI